MDWIASIGTIISLEMIRRKMWQGFVVATLNEVVWAYLAITRELYGFLFLCAVLTIQNGWAIKTWREGG